MSTSTALQKPFRSLGGFFAMALDTLFQIFRPPWAWREFLLQTWFVARVSLMPTIMPRYTRSLRRHLEDKEIG